MEAPRIGTVDIPARVERERYFRELTYVELSALFAGPLRPSVLARFAELAPKGTIGLVAPFVLTQREPPHGAKLWPRDASSGEFRDSAPGREALAALRAAVDQLGAARVVFRAPSSWSPSAANRERLARFFGEVATAEAVGAPRVWQPGGLWEVRAAAKLAEELGIACAFDPLVRAPGDPPEIFEDLGVSSLYLRIEGAGRAGAIRSEKLEELAALLELYEEIPRVVVFASAERWQDARNLKRLLEAT